MKKIFILFALLGLGFSQTVSNTGTKPAQFLKIGPGARPVGMGEAFVSVATGALATYWNPAGLAQTKGYSYFFTNSKWLAGIQYNYLAFAVPIPRRGVIGGALSYIGTDNMEVTTETNPEGTGEYFKYTGIAIILSYGKMFTDKFSFGFNTKYIYEKLKLMSASTAAVDIGLKYQTEFHKFTIGMNFQNFGGKMRLVGEDTRFIYYPDPNRDPNSQPNVIADLRTESYDLPMRFLVGVSMYPIETDRLKLLVAIDAVHPNDNTEYINAGAELSFNDMAYLRIGKEHTFMRDAEGGFTVGGGVRYRRPGSPISFAVDFAMSDYGRLENVKFVSVGLSF